MVVVAQTTTHASEVPRMDVHKNASRAREEPEQVEQEGDHRAGVSLDSSRLINHLVADGVAKDARDDVQE